MILDKIAVAIYRRILINRLDSDGSVFLFDYTDFDGLKKEPYSFKSDTGAQLSGGFYCYDYPKTDKLVIFDHGMGTGHRAYMREIETLCKAGYLVYSYDHEGTANSEGTAIRGLSGSIRDLDMALNALKNTKYYEGREIIVIGHSWGGFASKIIAKFHPEVKKVIPIAGLSSLQAAMNHMIPGIFKSSCKAIIDFEESLNPGYATHNATDVIRESGVKALICHSTDDPIVTAKDHHDPLKEVLSNTPGIRFVTMNGRGHNPNFTPEAVKLKDAFFTEKRALEKKRKLRTPEAKAALIAKYDFCKMTEQDMTLWNQIFSFIEE